MLEHDELTPEETEAQNQMLIRDLRGYYMTEDEDKSALERIRVRLLHQQERSSLPEARQPAQSAQIVPMPTLPFARSRRAYLSALVAAVVLVGLVGAFTLGFYLRQAPTTNQTPPILAHGWTLALKFSGTGPQTIIGKNIKIGHKYGWRLACTNTFNGWVSVKFNGVDESGGTTACSIRSIGTVLGPDAALTSPDPSPPIQTITITAAASTSWEFALFIGTYYPPLAIDADWQPLHEEWDGTGPTFLAGLDITLPKTGGLLYMCHGTGTIQIGLQSKSGVISPDITSTLSACDGQGHFNQYDQVSEGVNVALIDVTTGPENDWQVLLVGCVNEKPACGTNVQPAS